MIIGHGGNIYAAAEKKGCKPSEIIDMSSNINPLGPPKGLRSHISDHLDQMLHLPDVAAETIARRFAHDHCIDPDRVLAGNGTTQFIYTVPLALQSRKVLIIGPTYADYADACHMHRVAYHHFLLTADRNFTTDIDDIEARIAGYDTVFICNPNNPTGGLLPLRHLERLGAAHPKTRFVVDESYLPFVQSDQPISIIGTPAANIISLQSLSKIYRIPGLRIGFLVATPQIIANFQRYYQPWSVNGLAQAACDYLLKPGSDMGAFIRRTQRHLEDERRRFEILNTSPHFHVFASRTNFMLMRLNPGLTAEALCTRMLDDLILLRNCTNFHGLSDRYVRISLRSDAINQKLIQALLRLSNEQSESTSHPSRTLLVSH